MLLAVKELVRGTWLHNLYIHFRNCIPDTIYLKYKYRKTMGEELHLKTPVTFNEKLNWLKLYDRKELYTKLVDKYEVRNYVKYRIGEKYLVPLIAVYDKVQDIDFSRLPDQFVLKTTHDSGSVIICRDKTMVDEENVRTQLAYAMDRNYYYVGREWPYKNVMPRIICEQLLEEDIVDYKFYVFHGEPKYLYTAQGLVSDHSLRVCFYDMEWRKAPFGRSDYKQLDRDIPCPSNFLEMKEIAKSLAGDLPFVRIDLYSVAGKTFFSEITLTPANGWMPFDPPEYDVVLGKMINIV